MKDRIVFFILGAVLATVAYFVGDMDRADAQGRNRVFEGDVVIKGRLEVAGGEFYVTYDPKYTRDFEKIESSVGILASEGSASIFINKGPQSRIRDAFPASLILVAKENDKSGADSIISLEGNYDRDIYHISSDYGLVNVK